MKAGNKIFGACLCHVFPHTYQEMGVKSSFPLKEFSSQPYHTLPYASTGFPSLVTPLPEQMAGRSAAEQNWNKFGKGNWFE